MTISITVMISSCLDFYELHANPAATDAVLQGTSPHHAEVPKDAGLCTVADKFCHRADILLTVATIK